MNINPSINPRTIQVIQKQVMELIKKCPDGIQYALNESDILDIQADIFGPVGTPYAGGVFRCKLVLSSEFPRVPPKGFFLTKIFHPNISEKGEICVNTLKKDWDPTNWSLQHVFEVIRCLLIVPFPESALNEEAGKVFMEDYEEYAKHARLITELYALTNNRFVQPMSQSQKAVEKPKGVAMDISFENTQEDSPTKQNPEKEKPSDNNFLNSLFKNDRPDEVLMPVTNSLHTNSSMSPLLEVPFKKSESLPAGSIFGTGVGIQVSMNGGPCMNGGSLSAKKENDDKKKWRKRI